MSISGLRHSRRYLLALTVIAIAALALPARLLAFDTPPPTSAAFFQTSGPRTWLGTGDFYTNINGANNQLGHTVEIVVPRSTCPIKPLPSRSRTRSATARTTRLSRRHQRLPLTPTTPSSL